MAEVGKLLYIVVVDDGEEGGRNGEESVSFRYTRPVLQGTLQLMGCKARHAFKISQRVFEVMRNEHSANETAPHKSRITASPSGKENASDQTGSLDGGEAKSDLDQTGNLDHEEVTEYLPRENVETSAILFELYKRLTTIVVTREKFLNVVCDALSVYKYVGPNQRADLLLACRIRERKESVTILLCGTSGCGTSGCGTSGCGKSTLSALLGSRLDLHHNCNFYRFNTPYDEELCG